jgi:hypothetical protein
LSPGISASSTTKTGRHDIDEMVLKVALTTTNLINDDDTIPCNIKRSLQMLHLIILK